MWPHLLAAFAQAGSVVRVVLNAGAGGTLFVSDAASPYNSVIGIRFLATGGVQVLERVNGVGTWVSHGSWITPSTEISGNEEVRFTNSVVVEGFGDFDTEAAAEDAWTGIGTTQTWQRTETSSGEWEWDCDFQVRDTTRPELGTSTRAYTFRIFNQV